MLLSSTAYAMEHYDKLWAAVSLNGHLTEDKKWLYLLSTQLRFIDQHPYWRNTYLQGGLGYHITNDWQVWGGYTWIGTNNEARYTHTNRLWQQVNWRIFHNQQFVFSSRSRLEESKRDDAVWYYRFREKLALEWLKPFHINMNPLVYDELFFSLNLTDLQTKRLSQNRLFIGMVFPFANHTELEVGYINQYRTPSGSSGYQLNHIITMEYTIFL